MYRPLREHLADAYLNDWLGHAMLWVACVGIGGLIGLLLASVLA